MRHDTHYFHSVSILTSEPCIKIPTFVNLVNLYDEQVGDVKRFLRMLLILSKHFSGFQQCWPLDVCTWYFSQQHVVKLHYRPSSFLPDNSPCFCKTVSQDQGLMSCPATAIPEPPPHLQRNDLVPSNSLSVTSTLCFFIHPSLQLPRLFCL